MNRLLIIGASGHGKVVADIAAHCGYKDIAFLDDDTSLISCLNYFVIGVSADAEKYISEPGTYVGVPARLIGDKKMKYIENSWGRGIPRNTLCFSSRRYLRECA